MKSPEHRSRSPVRHHHRSNIPILFDCTGANHSSINHQADEGEADKAELAERESRRNSKRQELVRFDLLLTVRSGMSNEIYYGHDSRKCFGCSMDKFVIGGNFTFIVMVIDCAAQEWRVLIPAAT
jgi:hypothetical protein